MDAHFLVLLNWIFFFSIKISLSHAHKFSPFLFYCRYWLKAWFVYWRQASNFRSGLMISNKVLTRTLISRDIFFFLFYWVLVNYDLNKINSLCNCNGMRALWYFMTFDRGNIDISFNSKTNEYACWYHVFRAYCKIPIAP